MHRCRGGSAETSSRGGDGRGLHSYSRQAPTPPPPLPLGHVAVSGGKDRQMSAYPLPPSRHRREVVSAHSSLLGPHVLPTHHQLEEYYHRYYSHHSQHHHDRHRKQVVRTPTERHCGRDKTSTTMSSCGGHTVDSRPPPYPSELVASVVNSDSMANHTHNGGMQKDEMTSHNFGPARARGGSHNDAVRGGTGFFQHRLHSPSQLCPTRRNHQTENDDEEGTRNVYSNQRTEKCKGHMGDGDGSGGSSSGRGRGGERRALPLDVSEGQCQTGDVLFVRNSRHKRLDYEQTQYPQMIERLFSTGLHGYQHPPPYHTGEKEFSQPPPSYFESSTVKAAPPPPYRSCPLHKHYHSYGTIKKDNNNNFYSVDTDTPSREMNSEVGMFSQQHENIRETKITEKDGGVKKRQIKENTESKLEHTREKGKRRQSCDENICSDTLNEVKSSSNMDPLSKAPLECVSIQSQGTCHQSGMYKDENNTPFLIPPQRECHAGRITCCLDLDNTLVYTFLNPPPWWDPENNPLHLEIDVCPTFNAEEQEFDRGGSRENACFSSISNSSPDPVGDDTGIRVVKPPLRNRGSAARHRDRHYVCIRPHALEFVQFCLDKFEVVFFTGGTEEYAHRIFDHLEGQRLAHRLYRQHCTACGDGMYMKDLSQLGRPLDRVILFDDRGPDVSFQPGNVLFCEPFILEGVDDASETSRSDNELRGYIEFLDMLARLPEGVMLKAVKMYQEQLQKRCTTLTVDENQRRERAATSDTEEAHT